MSAPHTMSVRGPEPQFDFSIGEVPLSVVGMAGELSARAADRYKAFRSSAGKPLTIHLEESADARGPAEFSYDFQGAALYRFGQDAAFCGVRNDYALDSLLRILLSRELLTRDGFLLHAASVVRNGRAHVFTGRSGAGKSTVASLSPEGSVLTDEISLLRRENGEWRAYGTPFWGEFKAAGQNTKAPVAGIYELVQAPVNCMIPMRRASMLRALLPNVLFFSAQPQDNRRLLGIVGQAAEEISGGKLEFRKDQSFWEAIEA